MSFFSNLDTERYDRQYPDRQLVRRMLDYFRPHRGRLGIVAALLLLISVAGAAQPWIVARGVDLLRADLALPNIILLGGIILLIGIGNWLANWLRRRITGRVIGDTVLTLRTEAFRAAADHDLSFYDEFSSGRIVSRITSDTQELARWSC